MFEQLLGLGIVGSQLQRFLDFRSREIRFLLLEVDFREHRSNHRGIPRFQRRPQFLHRIIHLALAAVNFREPVVCRGAAGIGCKNGAKFLLRGISMSRGELLPSAPKVYDGRVTRRIGSGLARRRPGRFILRAKSRYVELGFDANQPRDGFVLRVQANRRESVRAKSFVRRLAFLVGLGLLTGLFQGQYQQRAVLRIIRLAGSLVCSASRPRLNG